jgi:hypothetical protein
MREAALTSWMHLSSSEHSELCHWMLQQSMAGLERSPQDLSGVDAALHKSLTALYALFLKRQWGALPDSDRHRNLKVSR